MIRTLTTLSLSLLAATFVHAKFTVATEVAALCAGYFPFPCPARSGRNCGRRVGEKAEERLRTIAAARMNAKDVPFSGPGQDVCAYVGAILALVPDWLMA